MTAPDDTHLAAGASSVPARYRRTVLSSYAHAGLLALVGLAVVPAFARWLDRDEFGAWVIIGAIAAYLELLELGVGGATIREVARLDSLGDRTGVRRTVATAFWALSGLGVVALAAAVGIAFALPSLIDLDPALARDAQIACLLVVGAHAVSIPSDTFGGALIAVQRYDLLNATLMATLLAQALAWVVVLVSGGGLVALGAVTAALTLVGQASRWWFARRVLPELDLSPREFERERVGILARISAWFSLSQLAWLVTTRIDVIVVGVLIGAPEAAIYAVGQKLAFACTQLVAPLTDAFFPLASALDAVDDRVRLRAAIRSGTRIAIAIALPLALIVGLLATPAIRAWVGLGFADAAIVAIVLAGNAALRALPSVGIRALAGSGAFRGPAIAFAVEAVVNLGASIGLGLAFGLVGVALGSLVATVLVQVGYLLPAVARRFDIDVARLLAVEARAHLPAAVLTATVGLGARAAGVGGIVPVLGAGVGLLGMYLGILACTAPSRTERADVIRGLLRRGRFGAGAPRVLLVDPSDRGGIVAYTALVAEGLTEAGATVAVLANRSLPAGAGAPSSRRCLAMAAWTTDVPDLTARVGNLYRWLRAAACVWWTTLRTQPDIVHFQAPLNRRYDRALVRALRGLSPVVLTAHDIVPFEPAPGDAERFAALYRALDDVLVHTIPAAAELSTLAGRAPSLIAHPALPVARRPARDAARDRFQLPRDGRVLGAVGFVRAYKGYDLLADAWRHLGDAAPLLLVVGEAAGSAERGVLARLQELPRVRVVEGFVDDETLGLAIVACDALLLPYAQASDSGVLHLGRAYGVPVIASDAPALAASVAETGAGVVVPREAERWARAAVGVLPPPPPPPPALVATGLAHVGVYLAARQRWAA